MTARELISMLGEVNPNAEVRAEDTYDEGDFKITGMIYNNERVSLTSEDTS